MLWCLALSGAPLSFVLIYEILIRGREEFFSLFTTIKHGFLSYSHFEYSGGFSRALVWTLGPLKQAGLA